MTAPAVLQQSWYRERLFVRAAEPKTVSTSVVPALRWLVGKRYAACMLGALRPIDRICNHTALTKLGLKRVKSSFNLKLALKVGAL